MSPRTPARSRQAPAKAAPAKKTAGAAKKGAGARATAGRAPGAGPKEPETTVEALDLELAELRKVGPVGVRLARSTLAMSARRLAEQMDSEETSATSKSMCGRVLLDTMDRLRELAPKEQPKDALDDLTTARQRRLARGSAS